VVRVLARGTARVAPGTKKKGTERKPAGQNRFRRRPGGLPGPTLRSCQRRTPPAHSHRRPYPAGAADHPAPDPGHDPLPVGRTARGRRHRAGRR